MNIKEYFETLGNAGISKQYVLIDEIKNQGFLKTCWKYNIAFIPYIVILIGLIIWFVL